MQSQGAGSDYYGTPMTGEYAADADGLVTTLAYGDRIDYTQDNTVWVRDTRDASTSYSPYKIDMGISSAAVTGWDGAGAIDLILMTLLPISTAYS